MTKFLKKTAFLLVVCMFLFIVFKTFFRHIEKKTYNSAFTDKLNMLKAAKSRQKIILVGGSSVGLGLSAALIEKETGIRAINLGHNLGFGFIDYQPFLLQQLHKDDIIVFSPEWNFYTEPSFHDEADLDNLIRYNPDYGRLLGKNEYVLRSYISKVNIDFSLKEGTDNAFRYHCFNDNGDIISHCDLPQKPLTQYEIALDSLMIGKFRQVFGFIDTHRTIILFPPTTRRIYSKYQSHFKRIQSVLRQQGFEVLDHVEGNVYDDKDFYDMEYHLICTAKNRRTAKLISYLKGF